MYIVRNSHFNGFATKFMSHQLDVDILYPPLEPPKIAVPAVHPFYPPASKITLEAGGTVIDVPYPKIGNSFNFKTESTEIKLVDGDTITYNRSEWLKSVQWQYIFERLTLEEANSILAFLKTNYGKLITLTTHLGDTRNVLCVTSPLKYTVNLNYASMSLAFEEMNSVGVF